MIAKADNEPGRARLLEAVADLLSRQIQAALADDLERVVELGRQADELTATIAADPCPPADTEAQLLHQIRHLQRRLAIALSAAREDVAGKLQRLRSGRAALKVYKGP